MNVRELRELLNEVPEGFTQEEFDETEVLSLTWNGEFESPCECQSGIIEISGTCDEFGNPIEDDGFPDTFKAFALLPHIDEVDPQLN